MSRYPQYAPPPSNSCGLAGFILSIVGWFSCGILCPIGLILSLIGLRKQPRGLALAGVIIGGLGSLWAIAALVFIIFFGGLAALLTCGGLAAVMPELITEIRMVESQERVERFYLDNNRFPTTLDEAFSARARRTTDDTLDGWRHALRFTTTADGTYTLTSDGPDGLPSTPDDISKSKNVRH